jgi:hypothetical protein
MDYALETLQEYALMLVLQNEHRMSSVAQVVPELFKFENRSKLIFHPILRWSSSYDEIFSRSFFDILFH